MAFADLHLHSEYSDTSPEWFLQRVGIRESYTALEVLYAQAKARGMDLVTVTDHDTIEGALRLHHAHPEDTFVSVEVTARFPEDRGKIHLLLYGIDEARYEVVQGLRHDVYRLRDYVRAEGLAHSVAHATYDMDGKLDLDKLERLILLFDVFEARNGTRTASHNDVWVEVLRGLGPEAIERLEARHGIEPFSADPWVKGFTAGSDCHAGLFIGTTWTVGEGQRPTDFLEALRRKRTGFGGAHGDYRKMAFSFYKVAHDFARNQAARGAPRREETLTGIFNDVLFEGRRLGFLERRRLARAERSGDAKTRLMACFLREVAQALDAEPDLAPDAKVALVHDRIAAVIDGYFRLVLESVDDDARDGDSVGLVRKLCSLLPNAFLSVPFLTTSRILFASSDLVQRLESRYLGGPGPRDKRVLWFTDTIDDLNGVSVTLRSFLECAAAHGLALEMVVCAGVDGEEDAGGRPNVLRLPAVYECSADFYPAYRLRVPSLLRSLALIAERNPHEIVVSTPGPVGLMGVLAARLLGVRCTGIYHTDFQVAMEYFSGGGMTPVLVEGYSRWFYSLLDEIRVPTEQYMGILEGRGYDPRRMRRFRRGIDAEQFRYDELRRGELRAGSGFGDTFTLLWAGRLSKDKNLDYLARLYEAVVAIEPDVALLVAGEGPSGAELEARLGGHPRVRFLGRVERHDLADWYSAADLFVFPSNMDTFGLVVLEAQACGLPCLVTNEGGPQELIVPGVTGEVLALADPGAWVARILATRARWRADPAAWRRYRREIGAQVRTEYRLEEALGDILGISLGDLPTAADPPKAEASNRRLPRAVA